MFNKIYPMVVESCMRCPDVFIIEKKSGNEPFGCSRLERDFTEEEKKIILEGKFPKDCKLRNTDKEYEYIPGLKNTVR